MIPIKRALQITGSYTKLAELCGNGCKANKVFNWANRNGQPPGHWCIAIEKATKGQVTRYDLRPDIFGTAREAMESLSPPCANVKSLESKVCA